MATVFAAPGSDTALSLPSCSDPRESTRLIAIGVGLGLVLGSLLASQVLPLPERILTGRTSSAVPAGEASP